MTGVTLCFTALSFVTYTAPYSAPLRFSPSAAAKREVRTEDEAESQRQRAPLVAGMNIRKQFVTPLYEHVHVRPAFCLCVPYVTPAQTRC
jgi:hypothetical protein